MMPRNTRTRPEPEKDSRKSDTRGDSGASAQGSSQDADITGTQELRRAARALDNEAHTAGEDDFFTQFRNTAQADKHRLLKTIQTKQQEAMAADAKFLDLIREPIAEALRPHSNSADHGSTRSTKNTAAAACPLIASGERALDRSKRLLALYEEATKVVDNNRNGLQGSSELEERWARDVKRLRALLDVGYEKAKIDVAGVLRGSKDRDEGYGKSGTGGDGDEAGAGEVGEEAGALLFMSGWDKQDERERFNVKQTLYEASKGVRRLSKSLPPEEIQ